MPCLGKNVLASLTSIFWRGGGEAMPKAVDWLNIFSRLVLDAESNFTGTDPFSLG